MKKLLSNALILISISFSIMNCQVHKNLNKETVIKDKKNNDEKILIGEFNHEVLNNANYSWFDKNFKEYEVETKKLGNLPTQLKNYRIEIFIGSWCSDSKRELPALYKILEHVKYPMKNLKMVAVDRQKNSGSGLENNKDITHVPTIIVYDKSNKEVGRIVESPVSAYLEEDLDMIIKGKPYKPNYSK